jgi:hypothetical protein
MRFAAIEVPGTIVAAPPQFVTQASATGQPATREPVTGAVTSEPVAAPEAGQPVTQAPVRSSTPSRIGAGVLGLGVVLGIAGLFPAYVGGASLASQPPSLVTHVTYLAAWTLSAVLVAVGAARLRVGALFGLGVSAVTFGLFVADVGTPVASGAHLAGAGLVLSTLGWLAATAGVALALPAALSGRTTQDGNGVSARRGLTRHLGRAASHEVVPLVALVLAAVGAAIAFAPAWDRFTLRTANGVTDVVTAGNAFANPAPVIVGNVLVMAAVVAVVIVAALWRPMRVGAALAAGVIVPMAAQALSAVVQIHGPTSPLQFGISPAQASQLGLTINAGLTPMFWVFCAFVATMILLFAWMLVAPESTPRQVLPYQVGPTSAAPASAVGVAAAGPGFVPPAVG